MKILAIDGSGLVASVAITEDDNLLAEYTTGYKKTHSQTLLPMIDEITRMLNLDVEEVDAIAVAAGPGSFTGLRIASATAKGIGLALDKPIISVPTVDALAFNLWGCHDIICPIMDARRGQVYTGLYTFDERNEFSVIRPQCAVAFEEIANAINELGKNVVFLGDGVPVFKAAIEESIKTDYSFSPAGFNRQRAAAVAALGRKLYDEGCFENADDHRPDYLRLSQAERERQEKGL
ncbi:MAG: tRNA (adenosine(37)-N6)-threonylcarbamoyltransferase complex dimerization subunit type 1 TsaB [Pseudobutyrivibrio sp.]|nr:tRNA (adenosine(37)-N6)-threonylcarbamoyltransferase complex dimerization subunit type 1 TsaB [Pseudobutyrivibrio sp.]MCF0186274.1 tRNA (adenosine(37)-N6)-threonylcarbamoyltransferase complex dimerization subunit type 1 TsaB [Bacteroidaceae bacterium]